MIVASDATCAHCEQDQRASEAVSIFFSELAKNYSRFRYAAYNDVFKEAGMVILPSPK